MVKDEKPVAKPNTTPTLETKAAEVDNSPEAQDRKVQNENIETMKRARAAMAEESKAKVAQ